MARNPEETRVVQLTAGLVSSGTAVTGSAQVDYPGNAFLLISVLAAGTSWSVALTTNVTGGAGAGGTAVTVAGNAAVTGTTTGLFSYHLNNKLSKFAYGSLSGVGTPTLSAVIVSQGVKNSQEGLTGNRPLEG